MNPVDHDVMELIARRWQSADAFYSERDDRTARVSGDVSRFASTPIEIVIDPVACDSPTVQRIALVAANLTARWARHVRVVVPGKAELVHALRRDGFTTLAQRIAREMRAADPFGDFAVGSQTGAGGMPSNALRFYVGPWRQGKPCTDDYTVWAAGWSAFGRRGEDARTPETAPEATAAAAAFAGSLGAADLFKRAIGHGRDHWLGTLTWDTWSSELWRNRWVVASPIEVPTRLDVGRVLLAGVGAIGSALVYALDMMPVTGRLTLLDRDHVDVTNLNRSPLFTALHAVADARKTDACSAFLAGRIGVETVNGSWREHAAAIRNSPFDVWISLTNEDGAWAELPFQLPPVVLHATTTSGWGLGAGRHIPRVEDCTLCRMPRPEAEFRGPCAEGEIAHEKETPVRAALPFLSMAAASLLFAELMKLSITPNLAAKLPNDVSGDLSGALGSNVSLNRGPTPNCPGCAATSAKAWYSMRQGTRFQSISITS